MYCIEKTRRETTPSFNYDDTKILKIGKNNNVSLHKTKS